MSNVQLRIFNNSFSPLAWVLSLMGAFSYVYLTWTSHEKISLYLHVQTVVILGISIYASFYWCRNRMGWPLASMVIGFWSLVILVLGYIMRSERITFPFVLVAVSFELLVLLGCVLWDHFRIDGGKE